MRIAHLEIVQLLLEYGADPYMRPGFGAPSFDELDGLLSPLDQNYGAIRKLILGAKRERVFPKRAGPSVSSDDDGEVFCICRKGRNGTSMIPCEGGCADWFHGKCVNIQESEQHHVEKYICPNCTRPGLETTFRTGMTKQPGMYIHYTISEDRSGDQQSVMSERLAALGSRNWHSEISSRLKNASLALLGRKSGFG